MPISTASIIRLIKKTIFFTPNCTRDVFLASYPRSGNTWIRAVLFHAIFGRSPKSLQEIDYGIPDGGYLTPSRYLLKQTLPNFKDRYVVKTHNPWQFNQEIQRVVYLVRDPRDVIPSYYKYLSRRSLNAVVFEDFALACITGSVWPGSWFEHVSTWKNLSIISPASIDFMLYENLKNLHTEEIRRLAVGIGIQECDRIEELLRHYDFVRMRQLEESGNRSDEAPYGFIGSGKPVATMREIVENLIILRAPHWRTLMDEFGYFI